MVNLKQLLTEGVFDKGILKAVFMAGGPGSGKSYVAGELFGIKTKHRFSVVWLSTLASLALIAWLAISSIIQVNNKMKEIDNDSII